MTRTLRVGLGLALALYCGTAMAIDFSGRSFNCAPNQTVFASALQRYVRLKDSDGDTKTKYSPTALALGYVWQQDNWKAGAAFTWEHGRRKYDHSTRTEAGDSKVRSDLYGVSLFGTMNLANNFYVDGSTFLGVRNLRMKDYEINGVDYGDSGRKNKMVFAMSLEGGYNLELGSGFVVTPHAGIDYAYTAKESYRMRQAGNRADYSIDSQSFWEIPLGVTLRKTFMCGGWAITPKADATLVTSLGGLGDAKNAQPGFAYRTADTWKVAAIGGDHLGARLTAGVDAKLGDRTSVGLDYTYEGRKDYNDHRISAMFGLSF